MQVSGVAAIMMLAGTAVAQREFSTIQASGTYDPRAETAIETVYPAQHHYAKGRFVDHVWVIALDHATYEDASNNADLQALEKYGQKLTNYYALTHPAQANFLGMVGGDTFGLDEERFVALPSNVSTIAESFEAMRVLWAQYTEDQPFTGYPGWEYQNPNGGNYTRAKNGFIAFDSVAEEPRRLANLKSYKNFEIDRESGHIAQWLMIRPNTEHDGSNSLDAGASWARNLLEPILKDKKQYHRHAFILTFAHAGDDANSNQVYTLVLGDLQKEKLNTEDNTYYDHYSILATTQGNWDLPSLGRYDCGANVFEAFNHKINHKNTASIPSQDENNAVLSGYLSSYSNPLPFPNVNCEGAGRAGVVSRAKKLWKKVSYSYYQWTFDY